MINVLAEARHYFKCLYFKRFYIKKTFTSKMQFNVTLINLT